MTTDEQQVIELLKQVNKLDDQIRRTQLVVNRAKDLVRTLQKEKEDLYEKVYALLKTK